MTGTSDHAFKKSVTHGTVSAGKGAAYDGDTGGGAGAITHHDTVSAGKGAVIMTYSGVRVETEYTRIHILQALLEQKQVVKLWEDGSDMILATLQSGETVLFYLVDYLMTAHQLQKALAENSQKGTHVLFLFWADMLLPNNGERFAPQDWMQSMLALYGDKIYGYDVAGNDVFIFPVYFEFQAGYHEHYIRWGKTVDLRRLRLGHVVVESAFLRGHLRMAEFEETVQTKSRADSLDDDDDDDEFEKEEPPYRPRYAYSTPLQSYYEILNVRVDARPDEIRKAYRDLARKYHPDLNTSAEATQKMQEINRAYQLVMAQFDDS